MRTRIEPRGGRRPPARKRPRPGWALLALLLPPPLCGGCGGNLAPGYPASGTVTWKGQPLASGTIQFVPAGGQPGMVGTEISAGHFALPNPPGLAAGSYAVRINARTGPEGPRDAHLTDPRSKEQIPPEYNEQTTLKAEITPGGPATFAFDLVDSGRRPTPRATPRRAGR